MFRTESAIPVVPAVPRRVELRGSAATYFRSLKKLVWLSLALIIFYGFVGTGAALQDATATPIDALVLDGKITHGRGTSYRLNVQWEVKQKIETSWISVSQTKYAQYI